MTLPSYAGYAIVPLHLLAGSLFALLPGSVHLSGWYAGYGAILTILATTVVFYAWQTRRAQPGKRSIWLQILLAALAAALPFFLVDFADPWHAIVYLPILGGSLLACLIAGHIARRAARG